MATDAVTLTKFSLCTGWGSKYDEWVGVASEDEPLVARRGEYTGKKPKAKVRASRSDALRLARV